MNVQALQRLNERFARAGAISFKERSGGLVVELVAGQARAVVALQGAQVLSYVPAEQQDVLWLSPAAQLGTGKAVRGGVPICWPWFGPHPCEPSRPAHGFVRTLLWDVRDVHTDGESCAVRLAPDARLIAAEGVPAMVELEVLLSDNLKLTLVTTNLGQEPLRLTQALHTYLAVGDIAQTAVRGLENRPFIDKLAGGARGVDGGPIHIDGEIDRIYQETPGTVVVEDGQRARSIVLNKTGSHSTVVWNPWAAKAERLGDMGPDGYRRMVCVETANAGDDVATIAPGGTHALSVTITSRRQLPK